MIYDLRRMIYLRCKYDIISVPSYAKHISSTAGGYHTEGISPVPQGTDIIKKGLHFREVLFSGCFELNDTNEKCLKTEDFLRFV